MTARAVLHTDEQPGSDVLDALADAVRTEVARRAVDPVDDPEGAGLRGVITAVVESHRARFVAGVSDALPVHDPPRLVAALWDRLAGFGPLSALMADPTVEEIWVNAPSKVFAAQDGEHRLTTVVFRAGEIEDLVERLLASSGRRLDRASPFVDARLADGSRLHVAIPPATHHWAVNIRKFVGLSANTLDELVHAGSLSHHAARFLSAAVTSGCNVVVCGPVGAGKTTLLNCLAGAIPSRERVITCEEVFELAIAHPDVVAMQCRQSGLEGTGEIPLRTLVKESLRMRPDRIVIGEVRGAECLDLLLALNSGCGGLTSVHANSAREALRKLTTLPLLAGDNVDRDFVTSTVAAVVDLVVFCSRDRVTGRRSVREILAVAEQVSPGGTISAGALFERGAQGGDALGWTGEVPRATERYAAAGIDVGRLLREQR